MKPGADALVAGLCLLLLSCESPMERRLRLENKKAEWIKTLEALPGYAAALDEGLQVAIEDSGMTAEERKKLESKFGPWDKKKVHAGLLRLCLTIGKKLSREPKVDLSESGIPESSSLLLKLVRSEGFHRACIGLFETEQAIAAEKSSSGKRK